jgi:hypothetical protein
MGSLSMPLHAITEVLAFFIGFRYFLYLRKRQANPINSSHWPCLLCLVCVKTQLGTPLTRRCTLPAAFFVTRQQEKNWASLASHTSSEGTILSHKGTEAQRFFGEQDESLPNPSFACV